MQRVLKGYVDNVNQHGGVHGRRLQLAVAPIGEGDSDAGAAAERLFRQEPVLAMLAPMTARNERDFTAAAESAQVPVVGPLTLYPESASASSTYVFHLLPGVPELAEALAVHLHPVLGLSGRPVVLLHAPSDEGQATAQAVEERLRARGYAALYPGADRDGRRDRRPPEAARRRRRSSCCRPCANLGAVAKAATDAGVQCYWLVPAPFVPPDIFNWPAALDGRIVLGYPTLPTDRTAAGAAALREFSGGDRGHRPCRWRHSARRWCWSKD